MSFANYISTRAGVPVVKILLKRREEGIEE
jgi:hypothetical protein